MNAAIRGLSWNQRRSGLRLALGKPGLRPLACILPAATRTCASDTSRVRGSRRRSPHRFRCRGYFECSGEFVQDSLQSRTRARSGHGRLARRWAPLRYGPIEQPVFLIGTAVASGGEYIRLGTPMQLKSLGIEDMTSVVERRGASMMITDCGSYRGIRSLFERDRQPRENRCPVWPQGTVIRAQYVDEKIRQLRLEMKDIETENKKFQAENKTN